MTLEVDTIEVEGALVDTVDYIEGSTHSLDMGGPSTLHCTCSNMDHNVFEVAMGSSQRNLPELLCLHVKLDTSRLDEQAWHKFHITELGSFFLQPSF